MDSKPRNEPGPARPRDGVHVVRGNEPNMWTKPPGQRPDRLNPPIYEPS
jgi:hypothetical protein